MKINHSLPHPIREIENTFITLADGAKLAARIWLPEDAEQSPVPAILEYVPYRKNDTLAHRDSIMHPYVAGHGYACVRVDVRGSGDSDGILFDEYLPQELSDGAEVIAWLAAQTWCTGSVGLLGKSWGGFNGLQIAALRPPALKAVISVCSTDDRYADDVHYVGGCVLGSEMLAWASTMLAYNAKPSDPRFVGERWREMWLDRMERTPPYVEAWLTHQRRDSFWKHGSVCEPGRFVTGRFVTGRFVKPGRFVNRPYGDINCPVYAVGGWADAYTNAIPRMLAGLSSPRKGLIGPWAHIYPHEGAPGPLIGFNQECLRWWDYWLKGIDTGIMAEPMLRAWMQDSEPPKTFYAVRSGRWVAENEWPPRRDVSPQRFYMDRSGGLSSLPRDTLENVSLPDTRIDFVGAQAHGLDSGTWCPYGLPGDMPPDQRSDDGLSLCFDSAPLGERVEILGFPEVTLALAADQPNALVAVRLCDVSPAGASARVSWGVLNLTHRHSHEHPTPLEPGKRYTVKITLNAAGYSLPAGHRWRVALSPTYWPQAWPSPKTVTLSVFPGEDCYLDLPTRSPRPEDESLAPFAKPEISPPLAVETLRAESRRREIHRDLISGRVTLTSHNDDGLVKIVGNDIEFDTLHTDTFTIVEGDPLSAEARSDFTIHIGRGEWRVRIETSSVMTADETTFRVTNMLDGYEGHTRVFGKTWTFSVARDLV